MEHSVIRSGGVAPHLLTCSGFVSTSKTRALGASNSRVMTTSSSFGNVMTAEPCRSGATALYLSLQLFEVVLDPILPRVRHGGHRREGGASPHPACWGRDLLGSPLSQVRPRRAGT